MIDAESPAPGIDDVFGLGDTTQSFFFSPQKPVDGLIWGAGPVFLIPTATDDLLGNNQWGAGPTALVLKQTDGWTYGILANQLWSFGASDEQVNATYLQPFLSYTTKMHTTYSLNTESTYDWEARQWSVPINLAVAQLVKIGGVPVQFQLGGRWYADGPDGGPDWGLRLRSPSCSPRAEFIERPHLTPPQNPMIDPSTRTRFRSSHRLETRNPVGVLDRAMATLTANCISFEESIGDESFNRYADLSQLTAIHLDFIELMDLAVKASAAWRWSPCPVGFSSEPHCQVR